tara:strand:+ start:5952 stop:6116 length:165 start_codon:yes stop_codon:yes gene_type:complete
MPKIEIDPDMVKIDADIVGQVQKITLHKLHKRMRDGSVTIRFERGEDGMRPGCG